MVTDDSCFRILIFVVSSSWSKDILWRPLLKILAYHQEHLIQHDYQSPYPNSYHMNWNSRNLYDKICVYTICIKKMCINTILSNAICIYTIYNYTVCIYIHLIRWIHIIIVLMISLFGVVKVANSHVCLWTCTDAPWVAQRRSVCSSPVLLAAPLSDGSSRCQGSWIAVSNVAWIHVSTWMQASL